MDERRRNIFVGLTSLAGLIGTVVLLMVFGYLPGMLEKGYTIRVDFESAAGLNTGSRVRYRGVDIGQVTQVNLLTPPEHGVRVTARINENVRLPRGVRPYIDSTNILAGSGVLALDIPTDIQLNGEFLANDGTEPPLSGASTSLIGDFAAAIKDALGEPMGNLDKLGDDLRATSLKIQRLSEVWTEVGENANTLLMPREADDTEGVGNLYTVLVRADERLTELKVTLAGINTWVNDEQAQLDFRQTFANARSASEKLDRTIGSFGDMTDEARTNLDQMTRRYLALADDLSKSIRTVQSVLDKVDQGDGTIGRMMNDPAIYNNLNETAQRASEALKEIQLLVEKWKAEGMPIQF